MKIVSKGIADQGKPTTADVQESLVNAANFKDFLLRNAQNMLAQTLPEYLSLQLKQKHLRRADPSVRENCIVIPQAATYELQDRIFVYKVVDGRAVSTRIEVFPQNDGKEYIVESGLKAGDVIIAEGAGLVREGAVVEPKNTRGE